MRIFKIPQDIYSFVTKILSINIISHSSLGKEREETLKEISYLWLFHVIVTIRIIEYLVVAFLDIPKVVFSSEVDMLCCFTEV